MFQFLQSDSLALGAGKLGKRKRDEGFFKRECYWEPRKKLLSKKGYHVQKSGAHTGQIPSWCALSKIWRTEKEQMGCCMGQCMWPGSSKKKCQVNLAERFVPKSKPGSVRHQNTNKWKLSNVLWTFLSCWGRRSSGNQPQASGNPAVEGSQRSFDRC